MAIKLGIVNVDKDILRALTAKQFRLWQHFATLEPFGETRADYRAASIVAMIYNRSLTKREQKRMTIDDAVLKFGEQSVRQEQTWEDKLLVARIMADQAARFAKYGEAKPPRGE